MLELTNHGFSREKAYRIVQQHAQNASKKNMSFYDSLSKDKLIMKKITLTGLKKMFDITDTSNQKVRFNTTSQDNNHHVQCDSGQNGTYAMFMKLGDT